jgi:hypothetical protein
MIVRLRGDALTRHRGSVKYLWSNTLRAVVRQNFDSLIGLLLSGLITIDICCCDRLVIN